MNKYKEEVLDYNVTNHGDTYEPLQEFGLVCPECCSTEIEVHNDIDEIFDKIEFNRYRCKSCGCEFEVRRYERLMKHYQKVDNILEKLCAVFFIFGMIFMAALIVMFILHQVKLGVIFSVVAIILYSLCGITQAIRDKMIGG